MGTSEMSTTPLPFLEVEGYMFSEIDMSRGAQNSQILKI